MIAPNLAAIPGFLVVKIRWLAWRNENHKGKLTKVPKTASNTAAVSTNPDTWSSFDAIARDASRSVAMSMLLTPVLRGALAPAVPMHVITAPEAGTGKSYLQDIASCIAIGDRCAVLSVATIRTKPTSA